jgi:hypothetical protein
LVPANGFAEYAPEPNPQTNKKDVVWFALNEDRPLFAFAGIWTTFNGDRGTKPVPGPHHARFPKWVKRRNTLAEHMFSASPPTTDEVDGSRSRHLGAKV